MALRVSQKKKKEKSMALHIQPKSVALHILKETQGQLKQALWQGDIFK